MITGDTRHSPEVAKQIGLETGQIHYRAELDRMSPAAAGAKKVGSVNIFARVVRSRSCYCEPLESKGEIVDDRGQINAPALKSAHIGIAMEAADGRRQGGCALVLLDDDFSSIVAAVRSGRRISTI